MTPRLFHPNFVVFPLHQNVHVEVNRSTNLKLISREIIFEIFQLCDHGTWTSRTDGQTDGQCA